MQIDLEIPAELKEIIGLAQWQEITNGRSEAAVYKLDYANQPSRYLKVASNSADSLVHEKDRLEWLAGRLPVPQVLYFGRKDESEYLLISEIPGLVTCDEKFERDMSQVAKLLAIGLKMWHGLDISDCPFNQTLAVTLEAARRRTEQGLVDESDFDEERMGRSASELFSELEVLRPNQEDLVLTHGDYCLPNILVNPELTAITGFIDLGRAGIADRYQDLALAARSLAYNGGEEWSTLLFKEYGLESVDEAKIKFYQLLDEFF